MRCLIITPKRFYMFHEFLAKELEKRGYDVSIVNDEYPENIAGVLFGKLASSISRYFTLKFFRENLSDNDIYDLILIIKGRGISSRTIEFLRKHAKRIVGYNFDSFRFNPSPLQWMNYVDKYATFDHLDSQKYNIEKVELFASLKDIQSTPKTTDLSVVLKNHSDRLLYLDRISPLFDKLKCEIFIYERNFLTFIRNFISHPFLMIKWRKYVSFSPMDYRSYIDMINRSFFTLDFAHPKQSGTTIRCFEAVACGTKLITNNKYIFGNQIFNNNNVIVHHIDDKIEHLYEILQKKKSIVSYNKPRTIVDFLDELLK